MLLAASHHSSKRIIYILIIGFMFFSCESKKSPKTNSETLLSHHLELAIKQFKTNPKYSKKLALIVKSQTKDSVTYYDACNIEARYLFQESQFDSSKVIRDKIISFWEHQPTSNQKSSALTEAYNSLCNIYNRTGKADSALIAADQALKYATAEKASDIYINISDIYKFKGDYAKATMQLRNALAIIERLKLREMEFPVYFAMGDIYLNLHDYEKSDYYYNRAEKDFNNRSIEEKEVFCNNRGNYYYYTKDFKKAEIWFLLLIKLSKSINDTYMTNFAYTNLADIYLNLRHYDTSLKYADKAEQYFKSIKFNTPLYYINAIRIGDAMEKGDFALATRLKSAIKNDNGIDPSVISIRNQYIEIMCAKKGDYKNAYTYLKKNRILNDSIRKEITQKRISEIIMQFQQDTTLLKKEILIKQQKVEVKALRLGYYLWALGFILISFLLLYTYIFFKRKHRKQRQQYIESITKLRVSNIRNRISPHFMFNVLNHEMDKFDDVKKNHFFILANLLRRSLEMTDQISIKLEEEIQFAKDYIELEKYRLGDDFNAIWEIDENVNPEKIHIIPMMLQIPIENALKHGLALIEGDKTLVVNIKHDVDGTRIYIKDNGCGYHPDVKTNSSGTGTGLRVLYQTMNLMNDKNTMKLSFEIHNIQNGNEHGTIVEIFIPMSYKFEY